MIAVILPSRGLIFSETADEILQNLKTVQREGWKTKIFFAHKLPLPECFEKPTNRALLDEEVSHLWYVEDDMILPPDILSKMLSKDKACVTINYPTTAKQDAAVLTVKGRVIYGGTGCTLVKREVFDELKAPYFRSDIMWIPKNRGDYIKFTGVKKENQEGYGYHDVNFFMNLYLLDIPVHTLDFTVGQRKLKALGKAGSNDGAHKIDEWKKVKEDRYFNLKKNLPVEHDTKLTTVLVPDGEIILSHNHAETLIKKGLASKPPRRPVVIDASGLI